MQVLYEYESLVEVGCTLMGVPSSVAVTWTSYDSLKEALLESYEIL